MSDARTAALSSLAAALGTLLCCALPSALVLLGFGTTVAAAVSSVPWVVPLSQNKEWVFLAAGAVIVGSRLYAAKIAPRMTPDGTACPPQLSRVTRRIWWASIAVYALGLFVAFALGPLLIWLDA